MLCTYAFDDTRHWETSREALRCLANTLLLSEPSRKLFADLGYVEKASEKYSVCIPTLKKGCSSG